MHALTHTLSLAHMRTYLLVYTRLHVRTQKAHARTEIYAMTNTPTTNMYNKNMTNTQK